MPENDKFAQMRARRERLFRVWTVYVLHIIVIIAAIVLSRGRILRFPYILELWAIFFLAHTLFLALVETREGGIRRDFERHVAQTQAAQTDDADDPVEKAKHDDADAEDDAASNADGYFTIGSDGELIPLSELDAEDDLHAQG